MPSQPDTDGPGKADPEIVASILRLLTSPRESHHDSSIIEAIEYADQAATAAWQQAAGRPAVERFMLAMQAAADEIEGLALAVDEAAGQVRDQG